MSSNGSPSDDDTDNARRKKLQSGGDNVIQFKHIRKKAQSLKPSIFTGGADKGGNAAAGEPLLNIPIVTKILLLMFIAVHLIFQLLSPATQIYAMYFLGFVPAFYASGELSILMLSSPITHVFVHGSWMHLGINAVMLLAFGSGLERAVGARKTLIVFAASALAGVLVHFAIQPTSMGVVIGASGALSGMFGAVIYWMYKTGRMGHTPYGIWPFIGIWVAISIGFTLLPGMGDIAWAAHLGGFFAGLGVMAHWMRRGAV